MAMDVSDEYETLMQFLYRSPVGLVQIARDGAVEMLNPMSSRLLMPLAGDGNLDNLFAVLAPVAPQLRRLAEAFPGASGIVCEALRIHPCPRADRDESAAQQVISLSLLKLDEERYMAALADVTSEVQREQESLRRKLQDAARVDALTGMPNRVALHELLHGQLHALPHEAATDGGMPGRRSRALLFLNCDRFRHINDAHGYAVGDQVLCMMGERLRSMLRQHGRPAPVPGARRIHEDRHDMAARLGGDEFALVLDDVRHAADAGRVAQRLLDALCMPYTVGQSQVSCSVSIGIVMADGPGPAGPGPGADALLQDASIAMLEAKRAGGARHLFFELPMRDRVSKRSALEAELRRALSEQELFVVYQPVVGLRPDGGFDHSAGVEALVRWRHPQRGLVPPVEFIGIAEESGLICELGDFVLAAACCDFMRWRGSLGEHAPRLLAVNLSRAQLARQDWSSTVRGILRVTGMAAEHLQLEVTESLAAQDEAIQACLHELKRIGIKLALDDFGTGYSSLSCLHQLPVDTVKIDRSFVCQVDTSAHHRVLVEATVMVAHSLGMNTVAEGIETLSQAAVVERLACDKGQGYFYSKPLEAGALEDWLLQFGGR